MGINEQIIDINRNKEDKKLTVGLINKELEELAKNINITLDLKKQCEIREIELQNDLRQTIANISHDLRTPLTSIIGYIQFLKLDNTSEEEKKEYLETAERRAKSLEVLLNDFYELSLIESLDYKINLEKVKFNRIIKEIVLGRYSDFINIGITPNIQILEEDVYIIAEHKSLERVIENLLSNAIRYAKDKISISLEIEESIAILKVSNNIRNLTNHDVEKVFDRFYMADKTRSGKGSGLGLAIVKGLVERMNGNIEADIVGDIFNIYCRFKIINI
ncbi:sensor histidine kinase [Clostridium cavendishii]|nr:HAMP domain-containing sensor histidine kinase [Clostridium cavendishii]